VFTQLLWFALWPFSALFYSAEEMGIKETIVPFRWALLVILSVCLLMLIVYLRVASLSNF